MKNILFVDSLPRITAFYDRHYVALFCTDYGMKKQNYNNHIRYYIPHHFIFLPLLGVLLVFAIVKSFTKDANQLTWILFAVAIFCILYLALMVRQHYALVNQDRIVRLEFRLRYFELFGKSSAAVEKSLSFKQVAALRFADDEQFRELIQRAISENLSPDAIKKSIRNWQADDMRV